MLNFCIYVCYLPVVTEHFTCLQVNVCMYVAKSFFFMQSNYIFFTLQLLFYVQILAFPEANPSMERLAYAIAMGHSIYNNNSVIMEKQQIYTSSSSSSSSSATTATATTTTTTAISSDAGIPIVLFVVQQGEKNVTQLFIFSTILFCSRNSISLLSNSPCMYVCCSHVHCTPLCMYTYIHTYIHTFVILCVRIMNMNVDACNFRYASCIVNLDYCKGI